MQQKLPDLCLRDIPIRNNIPGLPLHKTPLRDDGGQPGPQRGPILQQKCRCLGGISRQERHNNREQHHISASSDSGK